MGLQITCKCDECDYQFERVLGIGFFGGNFWGISPYSNKPIYHDLIKDNLVINHIEYLLAHEKNLTLKEDALTLKKIGYFGSHGFSTYICSKCYHLYNHLYFHLLFDGGEYIPQYFCHTCEYPLQFVSDIKASIDEFRNSGYRPIHMKSTEIVLDKDKKIPWHCPQCKCEHLITNTLGVCWD